MALKDRITDDMKAAMRAKDSARLGAIRLLLAAIKQREVDERITLDDAGVIAVVDKLLKQRRDAIAAYEQAGRTDLADKERAEAAVLEAYLPARLDAQAVNEAVQAIVARLASEWGRAPTPADMGKLMAAAKAELSGRADMAQVSAAVKAAIAP
ncbi:Yqey-like protein [Tepidimonas thermarum]|uniref:Yqey-like protein n=1 Tax=Tepidimonas thermarum TaxID=335431 RepID=A0A554X269_9BURK|nr:GatB/YqeY domain-containing protein [Tepidimonas thermarum]TSE29918.1 Yqey-like protein [Tepidimonas thermarum]